MNTTRIFPADRDDALRIVKVLRHLVGNGHDIGIHTGGTVMSFEVASDIADAFLAHEYPEGNPQAAGHLEDEQPASEVDPVEPDVELGEDLGEQASERQEEQPDAAPKPAAPTRRAKR